MKITKSNSDAARHALYFGLNKLLETSAFPPTMKLANVTPVYKKGNRSEKDNCRPVSLLPNLCLKDAFITN